MRHWIGLKYRISTKTSSYHKKKIQEKKHVGESNGTHVTYLVSVLLLASVPLDFLPYYHMSFMHVRLNFECSFTSKVS